MTNILNKETIIVLKFGGEALANIERVKNVANIIKAHIDNNEKVVVVVSAMLGVTDTLAGFIEDIKKEDNVQSQEEDVVLASGEQIAAGLLAIQLTNLGFLAKSFMGWQLPIITTDEYSNADVKHIDTTKIIQCITSNCIPVITGFQGITEDFNVTTLGRGGSDTTAISLAQYLQTKTCYVYKDVSGIYSCDPKQNSNAKFLNQISYDDMLELVRSGAKVLHKKAVEIAKDNNIKIIVRSFLEKGKESVIC